MSSRFIGGLTSLGKGRGKNRVRALMMLPPTLLSQTRYVNKRMGFGIAGAIMFGVAAVAMSSRIGQMWKSIVGEDIDAPELDEPKGGIDLPEAAPSPSTPAGDVPSIPSTPPSLPSGSGTVPSTIQPPTGLSTPSTAVHPSLQGPGKLNLPKEQPAAPAAKSSGSASAGTSIAGTTLVKGLAKDYRGRYEFSKFKGAEALTKYGSYTDAEGRMVQALKESKANTGASGGMTPAIAAKIRAYSLKHGVDPDEMIRVVKMESGGNPNAISSTGAIGLFQFTGATATGMGITNRFDVDQNIEAGILLAKQNSTTLKNAGLATDATSVYLAHQLGPASAKEVLDASKKDTKIADLSLSTQRAVKLNYGGDKAETAKEYVALTKAALANRDASVAIKEPAPTVDPVVAGTRTPNATPVAAAPSAAKPVAKQTAPVQTASVDRGSSKEAAAATGMPQSSNSNQTTIPQNGVLRTKNGIYVAVS